MSDLVESKVQAILKTNFKILNDVVVSDIHYLSIFCLY